MTQPPADAEPDGPRQATHRMRPRRRARRRVSVVGVFGELLITAGVVVLMFLGWQVWWNSAVLAGQQTSAASKQAQQWLEQSKGDLAQTPTATPKPGSTAVPGAPPVMEPVAKAKPLGVMYVPRFGDGWKRIIRESVDVQKVLNSYDAGVGHYPDTQMPGAVGNFASPHTTPDTETPSSMSPSCRSATRSTCRRKTVFTRTSSAISSTCNRLRSTCCCPCHRSPTRRRLTG